MDILSNIDKKKLFSLFENVKGGKEAVINKTPKNMNSDVLLVDGL